MVSPWPLTWHNGETIVGEWRKIAANKLSWVAKLLDTFGLSCTASDVEQELNIFVVQVEIYNWNEFQSRNSRTTK